MIACRGFFQFLVFLIFLSGCAYVSPVAYHPDLELIDSYSSDAIRNPANSFTTPKDLASIAYYGSEKFKHPNGLGLCLRYVKCALLEAGIVGHYLKTVYAKDSWKEFDRLSSLVNVTHLYKHQIHKAPRGAIVVYGPNADNKGYGHAEIKVAPSGGFGFVSDYYRATKNRASISAIYVVKNYTSHSIQNRTYNQRRSCRVR